MDSITIGLLSFNYQWSKDMVLFVSFGCTHPLSPVQPFLLMQNLPPKDIAGSDIVKLKVSCHLQMVTSSKVLS